MMKKKILLLIFCTIFPRIFASVEFVSDSVFKFPMEDSRFNGDEFSLRYNSGVKFSAENFQFVWFGGIGTTKFPELAQSDATEFFEMNKKVYGAKYEFLSQFVSWNFLAGSLVYANGISRLKNPKFTVPGALKNPSLLSCGMSPSLPKLSTAEQKFSAAVSVEIRNEKIVLPALQLACFESGELYFSSFRRIAFPMAKNASVSFTGGFFELSRENSDSWFQKKKFFAEKKYFAAEGECNLVFKNFRLAAASGIHENPFGGSASWFREENFLFLGDFTLHSFFYCADDFLITANGSEPRVKNQFCLNPQMSFWVGKRLFSAGILVYSSERKSDAKKSVEYGERKAKAAVSMESARRKISASVSAAKSELEEDAEFSAQIKFSHQFANFSIADSFSVKNEDATKNTYTFSQYFYPKKNRCNASLGISVVDKDGEFSFSPNAGATFRGGKKIKWNIKTAFSLSF